MANEPNQQSTPQPAPAAAPPPLQQPGQQKQVPGGAVGKGCLGCLGVIVLLAIIGVIIDWIGPSITISGTSGQMKYKIVAMSADTAGFALAQEIYKAATKNPAIKTLSIEIELGVLGGVVDKYGKTVNGPFNMGTITVDDLGEVRRYNDALAYAVRTKEVYSLQISRLNYSNLLEK